MIQSTEITATDIAHHYDELDEFYRELWGTHLHHGLWITGKELKDEAVINMSLKVLNELGDIKKKKLLDIGCGYGETARLAEGKGSSFVTGITLSTKQFQFANKHSAGNIHFVLGDWLSNSFPDEAFDGAYSIECFSHINDKLKFFAEVKRTLKPGSRFVMAAWLAGSNPTVFDNRMILEPICLEGRLPSLCNTDEVKSLIKESGMKLLKFEDLSDRVSKTWSISVHEVFHLLKTKAGRSYFLNKAMKERKFALSVFRILMGYKKGCFHYGIFTMET